MSDIKHSPLPFTATGMANDFWLHDATGKYLTSGYDCIFTKEDADFIVRACNSHYDLIDALKNCRNHLKELYNNVHDGDLEYTLIQEANSVLSKAKGESND